VAICGLTEKAMARVEIIIRAEGDHSVWMANRSSTRVVFLVEKDTKICFSMTGAPVRVRPRPPPGVAERCTVDEMRLSN